MTRSVRDAAMVAFAAEGFAPSTWSNGPGFLYGWHEHPYHKVLVCIEGSITFHTEHGDIELGLGERLDLPPDT